jgi:toxin ParE1/3/4
LNYRLVGRAEAEIDEILLHSAREWGLEAADRYDRLMRAAFAPVAALPMRAGSHEVARVPGVRVLPLRPGRVFVSPEQRVGRPRHLVVYRVAADNTVAIIGVVHDRMLLNRAIRQRRREAER